MSESNASTRPIFIHGMWRTASTHIWNKFRGQQQYRAYYEPLHEGLFRLTRAELESVRPQEAGKVLRHPETREFIFAEYPFKSEGGIEGFEKHLSYERYCLQEGDYDEPLRGYVGGLISFSWRFAQCPVLQFNRALLRSGWLKSNFLPRTILLLRHPQDLWKSFLSIEGLYFPTMICLILGQNRYHPVLRAVAERLGVPFFLGDTVDEEFRFYQSFALERKENLYPAFYEFYILSCAYNLRVADSVLDMTALTCDKTVREAATQSLRGLGIDLSFDDCKVPSWPSEAGPNFITEEEASSLQKLRQEIPGIPAAQFALHRPQLGGYFRKVLAEFATASADSEPVPSP
jgi:hypothetical protein